MTQFPLMEARRMWYRTMALAGALALTALLSACGGMASNGGSSDQARLTAEEITSVDVNHLYDVVQRLRPRWLEVRAARSGFAGGGETAVVVYLDRTLLGGVDELRNLGVETAAWMEYLSGSVAQARLPGIGGRHVEGAIVVHTVERDRP